MARFKHKKTGGLYRKIIECLRESDKEPMVVYQSVETGVHWTRPLSEWNEKFEVVPERYDRNRPVGERFENEGVLVHRGKIL